MVVEWGEIQRSPHTTNVLPYFTKKNKYWYFKIIHTKSIERKVTIILIIIRTTT